MFLKIKYTFDTFCNESYILKLSIHYLNKLYIYIYIYNIITIFEYLSL